MVIFAKFHTSLSPPQETTNKYFDIKLWSAYSPDSKYLLKVKFVFQKAITC